MGGGMGCMAVGVRCRACDDAALGDGARERFGRSVWAAPRLPATLFQQLHVRNAADFTSFTVVGNVAPGFPYLSRRRPVSYDAAFDICSVL
jgi:hypothetical protein